MKVVWTTTALRRAADIASALGAEDPAPARDFVHELFSKVEALSGFPKMGRVVPEVGKPHIREIFVRGYRVVYVVHRSQVSIRTIRHTRERR